MTPLQSQHLGIRTLLGSLLVIGVGCGVRTGPLVDLPDAAPGIEMNNACGGDVLLSEVPLAACGECGLWQCDGPNALVCMEGLQVNACGECGPLPEEVCNERDDNCDGVVDEGCVLRALATPEKESRVRLSGDWMVVDSIRRNVGGDILAINLVTGEARTVSESTEPPTGQPRARWSAIDGDLIAYFLLGGTFGRGPRAIEAYDLSSGETFTPPTLLGGRGAPNVDDGRVVFSTDNPETGDADVILWEPLTGRVERIGDEGVSELDSDLSGPWLALEVAPPDDEIFGRHVEAWNLETGERIRLSEGLTDGWHVAPAIDGHRVVWQREHGRGSPARLADLYVFDLETRERTVLSEGTSAHDARIDGDLVCWSSRSGTIGPEIGVIAVSLVSGARQVMNNQAQLCDLSGNRIAWLLSRRSLDAYHYLFQEGEL